MPITFQNIINSSRLDWLHDYVLLFLIFIIMFVGGILISLFFNFFLEKKTLEVGILEVVWTILPSFVLIFIGGPSLYFLYSSENRKPLGLTIKITGHQWYWRYDYRDFNFLGFDSYLKPIEELTPGEPRVLETDNHTVVPLNTNLRLIVNSADVLHRWAIPALRAKADANPGRTNILYLQKIIMPGLFYGQCSEICGANHRFIPINLEITPFVSFLNWRKRF